MDDYEALCQVTKSNTFHGNMIPARDSLDKIGAAIVALGALDAVKKTFFYGREYPHPMGSIELGSGSFPNYWIEADKDGFAKNVATETAVDVIHSILGIATEAGELLELLYKTVDTKIFDPVNFAEEIGDVLWYQAIGCTAVGTTIDAEQVRNIAKLQSTKGGRYKGKFDAFFAENRNFAAERNVLEVGMVSKALEGTSLDQSAGVMPLEQRTKMEALERFYKAATIIGNDELMQDKSADEILELVAEVDNAHKAVAALL